MKKLHLIKPDEIRPVMGYAQVRDGIVRLTDGFIALKIPAHEVFGEGVIGDDEELYFNLKMWGLMGFHTAKKIFRKEVDGLKTNEFIVISKGATLTLEALTASEFVEKVGRFPDIDCIYPETTRERFPLKAIGLNPAKFKLLSDIWGGDIFTLEFVNFDKAIIVRRHESEGVGLIMPLLMTYVTPYFVSEPAKEDDFSDML